MGPDPGADQSELDFPGSAASRLAAVALVLASLELLAGTAVEAASPTANKSDYQVSPARRSRTEVPKSIYLTPKSDRLETKKSDRKDSAPATQESPEQDEPWVAKPDDSIEDPEVMPDEEVFPGVAIPTDPHTTAPAKAEKPVRSKKTKRKAGGRPTDIALHDGRLKLNKFHTLTMDMQHSECRDFPNIFIADYDLPRSAIDILADNMLIVQKRICADNGAVFITCYQNSATISMRQAKPNDGCQR